MPERPLLERMGYWPEETGASGNNFPKDMAESSALPPNYQEKVIKALAASEKVFNEVLKEGDVYSPLRQALKTQPRYIDNSTYNQLLYILESGEQGISLGDLAVKMGKKKFNAQTVRSITTALSRMGGYYELVKLNAAEKKSSLSVFAFRKRRAV